MVGEHFFDKLSIVDKRTKIIDYLMHHRSGSLAYGTIKAIAKETNLSTGTVQRYITKLLERGVLEKRGQSVYLLPPALIPLNAGENNNK